jgi:hypothetical protein
MVVCEFAKMQAFGWNDNNPIQFTSCLQQIYQKKERPRGATKLQTTCPRAIHMYNYGMQGVDRHDQLRSNFALASCHGFKKYYIMHQLAQVDIVITNAGIYFSLANPHLKNKKGQHRKFNEDIAFIAVNSIDWQTVYGNSILDAIDAGTTHTPSDSDNKDEDVFDQLGVPNRSANISPIKDLAVTCHPISPFDKEFMDLHEIKYITKKGGESVTTIDLKKWIGKN